MMRSSTPGDVRHPADGRANYQEVKEGHAEYHRFARFRDD